MRVFLPGCIQQKPRQLAELADATKGNPEQTRVLTSYVTGNENKETGFLGYSEKHGFIMLLGDLSTPCNKDEAFSNTEA